MTFLILKGKSILLRMVKAIQANKAYLGEIDGLIGDGDHGMNMNKGFSVFEKRYECEDYSFSDGLEKLADILMGEIGGSMGPIYGTFFMEMAEVAREEEIISAKVFDKMLKAGIDGLCEIVDARMGDKTLMDTLLPAHEAFHAADSAGSSFSEALEAMKNAATAGMESTKDMAAKYGRSSRLGERSRGVLDAGATSCCILLIAMAEGIENLLA